MVFFFSNADITIDMNARIKNLIKRNDLESGFTLIEIAVSILIVGVLAAFTVPALLKYQGQLDSQAQKAQLQSASILIEQEQVDNNGLFPKYIPNELKANATMKNYSYTYSNDRTKFCLQANTPSGKWFISSENKIPNQNVCTQANVGEGSSTPWQTPVIDVPTINTFSNSWSDNETASVATIKINGVTCDLDSEDTGEWSGSTVVSYSVKINNSTRGLSLTTPWSSNLTVSPDLPGWLPGDSLNASVQARCTITSGTAYSYMSDFSASKTGTVDTFTVKPAAYTSTPTLNWKSGSATADYAAAWGTAFCPAGEKKYTIEVIQDGTVKDTTGRLNWASSRVEPNVDTRVTGGKSTIIRHYVSCVLADARVFRSTATDATLTTPLRPPSAPTGFASNNDAGETVVLPNRLRWDVVTCAVGTPEYRINRTTPGAASAAWQTERFAERDFASGTSYTYNAQARCTNGTLFSDESPISNSNSFTAVTRVPAKPSIPSDLRSDGSSSLDTNIKNNRLLWDSVVCDSGASPRYRIQKSMDDGASSSSTPTGWMTGTSYSIQTGWLAWGSKIGFQVQAKCVSPTGDSDPTNWSSTHAFTTAVTAPNAPGGISNNSRGRTTWNAVSCPSGTTPWYQLNRVQEDDRTTNALSEWLTATSREVGFSQGYYQGTRVKAECRGPNATSNESNWSNSTQWLSIIDTPGKISNWRVGGPDGQSFGETWDAYNSCPIYTMVRYWVDVRGASAGQYIFGPIYLGDAGYNRVPYSDGGSNLILSSVYVECYTVNARSALGAESYHKY